MAAYFLNSNLFFKFFSAVHITQATKELLFGEYNMVEAKCVQRLSSSVKPTASSSDEILKNSEIQYLPPPAINFLVITENSTSAVAKTAVQVSL